MAGPCRAVVPRPSRRSSTPRCGAVSCRDFVPRRSVVVVARRYVSLRRGLPLPFLSHPCYPSPPAPPYFWGHIIGVLLILSYPPC
eukprot:4105517-Pyramimonas_sp.AAC.1